MAKQRENILEKGKQPEKKNTEEAENAPQEAVYNSYIPQEGAEGYAFYAYERQIIQAVVRHGEKPLFVATDEEGNEYQICVAEYVNNELQEDNLSLHNPIHRTILSEAIQHMGESGFATQTYFIKHPDVMIARLAADLCNNRYELSKYHSKSQKIISEEERLYEDVPMFITNFKSAIIREELTHIARKLQDAAVMNNPEECKTVMERYKVLHETMKALAKKEGDRIIIK